MKTGDVTAGRLRTGTPAGRWVLAATIGGSGVAMLDATVVTVALTRIGAELQLGFAGLQWISNAYTLTLASFILLGGVLGDRFGRRRIFVLGTVWFAAASLLCAVSPNAGVLIAARALQGIGGALLAPGSLAIIAATFDPRDRSRAVGTWSGLGGIASAAGPFVGGWLVELDWRWVFGVNLPVAAAVVVIALRHVPESREPPADRQPLDVPGTALVVVLLGLVTYGLTRAGTGGWGVPSTVTLAVAAVVLAGFVAWERRTAHPLIPLSIFANRTFTATNVVTLFVYAALGVYFFLVVVQLQAVAGWSPVASGTAMLPATAVMLVLSGRFGALSDRVGPRPLMTAGALVAAAGFALSLRIGPQAEFWTDVLPAVGVLGLGLACTVAPLTAAVLGSAPDHLAGAASGINNAVARTAGLVAVAAVPVAAGLTGAGLADAPTLDRGFRLAMLIGGGLLVAGAAVAWFAVPGRARPSVAAVAAAGDEGEGELTGSGPEAVHRRPHCPVAGPPLHVRR